MGRVEQCESYGVVALSLGEDRRYACAPPSVTAARSKCGSCAA